MKRAREWTWMLATGAFALAVFQVFFGGFFPSANGHIGHDYGYFFPQLLTGFYWFEQNGPWAVPWFTPALGGGLPYYPNPANTYYSVPQLLVLFMDPLAAVRVSLVLFAAVGYGGAYLMLRRALGCGPWAALLGAVLYLFNGFYSARMLVGHLAFHSIMVLPWIAWLAARPLPERGRLRRALFDALAAGALITYMFQSAYFYGIPAVVIAVACVALLASLHRPGELGGWSWIPRLGGAGAVSLLLCCSKFNASIALMSSFPRSGYPLPGFDGIGTGLWVLARALFWYAPPEAAEAAMTNTQYNLARHEFEFGVTPVPLVLMLLGALLWVAALARGRVRPSWSRSVPRVALVVVLLVVPFAINVYSPGWNAFLKTVPFVKSSSSLLRNMVVYMPVAIALGALGLEALPARARAPLALAGIALALVFVSRDDRHLYAEEIYDPGPIVEAWHAVRAGGEVPPVRTMTAPFDARGNPHTPIDRNDALVRGESQLICYEALFGYQLEFLFPLHALRLGPAELRGPEGYNTRNPALFVFPAENEGRAGDPFRVNQLAEMRAFLSYRPFPFARSARQIWLDRVNVLALALAGLALATYPLWRPRARAPRATA